MPMLLEALAEDTEATARCEVEKIDELANGLQEVQIDGDADVLDFDDSRYRLFLMILYLSLLMLR